MTEQRLVDVFTAVRAHRDDLTDKIGRLMDMANNFRAINARRRKLGTDIAILDTTANEIEVMCGQMGAGLVALTRHVDNAMDDTQPIDQHEIARANAEDE